MAQFVSEGRRTGLRLSPDLILYPWIQHIFSVVSFVYMRLLGFFFQIYMYMTEELIPVISLINNNRERKFTSVIFSETNPFDDQSITLMSNLSSESGI